MVALRMARMPELQCIGDYFLQECSHLKEATFEGLPTLTEVGSNWLYGCPSLEKLRLTGLPRLAPNRPPQAMSNP